ncbi:hypothetical protein H6M51_22480 [Rhizobium sp. AQ_MP]|uniref:hypothetical protein n=1 Tax=Rhizobium sp. AQ_MP TaxID=2761536 RepID=UPI00163B5613|nr:hypothetical protein [Rhizobium sp. AQ_MP]MBC2775636.1 hypothetical protein [Rhizobium sp. AQ_MP]
MAADSATISDGAGAGEAEMSSFWKWVLGIVAGIASAVFIGMQQYVQDKTSEILQSLNFFQRDDVNNDPLLKQKWYLTLFYMNLDSAGGWKPAFEEYSVTFNRSPNLEGQMVHIEDDGRTYQIAGFKWPKKLAFTYKPLDDEGPGFGTYILQRVERITGGLDVYVGSAYVNACANTLKGSCDDAGPQKVCRVTLSDKPQLIMNMQYSRHYNTPCVQIDGGLLGKFAPRLNEADLR